MNLLLTDISVLNLIEKRFQIKNKTELKDFRYYKTLNRKYESQKFKSQKIYTRFYVN